MPLIDALRVDVGEQLAQRAAERHARRDLRHHADVEALRGERRRRYGGWPSRCCSVERAGRPAASGCRRRCEAEVAAARARRRARRAALEAAGDLLEWSAARRPARAAARPRAARGRGSRARGWPFFSSNQARSAPLPSRQLERQRRRAASARARRRAAGSAKTRAAPAPPVAGCGEQGWWKRPCSVKRSPHSGRRRRVEADVVLAQAVAHDQLDVGRARAARRCALLVDPAQGAAADHELGLPEEPVGGVAVVGARRAPPPKSRPATWMRPLGSRRTSSSAPSISSCVEARLEREQRARRQRRDDARQAQRDAPSASSSTHVAQLESPAPSRSSGLDRADPHAHPERRAGARLDRRTPFLDVRQNQPVK